MVAPRHASIRQMASPIAHPWVFHFLHAREAGGAGFYDGILDRISDPAAFSGRRWGMSACAGANSDIHSDQSSNVDKGSSLVFSSTSSLRDVYLRQSMVHYHSLARDGDQPVPP